MKIRTALSISILVLSVSVALHILGLSPALADPAPIYLQGRLTTQDGQPLHSEEPLAFTVQLYDSSNGGNPVGDPLGENVSVVNGVFVIPLTGLDPALLADAQTPIYAEIVPPTGEALTPRIPLGATPYALVAERLRGLDPGSIVQTGTFVVQNLSFAAGSTVRVGEEPNATVIAQDGITIAGDPVATQADLQSLPPPSLVLDDLTDVSANTPTNGQVLKWSEGEGKWGPSGDLQGGAGSEPIGSIKVWLRPDSVTALPEGWLICDGSTVNDTFSPFNGRALPDLRGRVVIGHTGLTNENYLTSNYHGGTGGNVPTGGVESLNLAHTHDIGAHQHTIGSGGEHSHGGRTGAEIIPSPEVTSGPKGELYFNWENRDHYHHVSTDGAHDHGGLTGSTTGTTSLPLQSYAFDNRQPYAEMLVIIKVR
jgi:hypothetical protein